MQDYYRLLPTPRTPPSAPPLRNALSLRITGQENFEAGTTTS
jgi:hypothetical protein